MRVVIRETPYEYTSDFPAGWEYSSGDYFKRPVNIGGHLCFVKRFEQKTPDSISGWKLLVNLKFRYAANLSPVHDIASVEERGKRVYYVFYECLKGNTLNNLIDRNQPLNLHRLTEDLFRAFASLQKYGYWFADFVEKNIFYDESKKNFVLIDLDSAQPLTKAPDDSIDVSKDYWGRVFDFYTQQLKYNGLKVSDLPGLSLNYLQVIFLILRLKLSFNRREQHYHYADFFHQLPALLDQTDPVFRDVFRKVYNERTNTRNEEQAKEIYEEQAKMIQELIKGKIIPGSDMEPEPEPGLLPVIEEFTSSTHTIVGRGSFELRWKVKYADRVELHKNGDLDSPYGAAETGVTRTAVYDGEEKTLSYKLIAYNKEGQAERELVPPVRVIDKKPDDPPPGPQPVINVFGASAYKVRRSGDRITLNWNVENADRYELHRNGKPESRHGAGETSAVKTVVFDEGKETVTYKLIAFNGNRQTESSSITIRLEEETDPPLIHTFAATTSAARSGDRITLSWNVENADRYELRRNGSQDGEFKAHETSVVKTVVFDEGKATTTYKLIAFSKDKRVESSPVVIAFREERDWTTVRRIILTLVALAVVAFVIRLLLPNREPVISAVRPNPVFWEDPITIYGKNFPQDTAGVQVFLNHVQVDVVRYTKDSIVVAYPPTTPAANSRGIVKAALVKGGDTVRSPVDIVVWRYSRTIR